MRRETIPWLVLLLGGCIGTNPEWEAPMTSAWVPETRCDGGDPAAPETKDRDGEDGGPGESEGDEDEPGEPGEGSCAVGEAFACGEGLTACESEGGWFCADLREHDEHCGECFNDCAAYGDAMCQAGECYCRGGPWMQLCAEGCADTRTDPTACGVLCVDCRVELGPNARCETGVCLPPAVG